MNVRTIALLWCLASPFICATARADYADTKWGMTLAEVQKLYPGGHTLKTMHDVQRYAVRRSVGGVPGASIYFDFTDDGQLTSVLVFFEKDYLPLELGFEDVARDEAHKRTLGHLQLLKDNVTKKYGPPKFSTSPTKWCDAQVGWQLTSGERILLAFGKLRDSCELTLGYAPATPPPPLKKSKVEDPSKSL